MATMTLSLPGPMKAWIEAETRKGDYASPSDFMRDLVRREREKRERTMSIDELRRLVADARAGGVSERAVEEIVAEGDRIARVGGLLRG